MCESSIDEGTRRSPPPGLSNDSRSAAARAESGFGARERKSIVRERTLGTLGETDARPPARSLMLRRSLLLLSARDADTEMRVIAARRSVLEGVGCASSESVREGTRWSAARRSRRRRRRRKERMASGRTTRRKTVPRMMPMRAPLEMPLLDLEDCE
jgi:hypothetical protein